MSELNKTEYDVVNEILTHRKKVIALSRKVTDELMMRAHVHDQSKLVSPEKEVFEQHSWRLQGLTYFSKEYKLYLTHMDSAIQHHYTVSRHHPECFTDGINGMNLVDILEMLCDWRAACDQHKDGDIFKSIQICKQRFNISDQLAQILVNTVNDLL